MTSFIRRHLLALAGAGIAAAVASGAAIAYAVPSPMAAPTPSQAATLAEGPAPSADLAAANAAPGQRGRAGGIGVIGKVTAVSATGGRFGSGTITVTAPDGKTVSGDLAPKTRVVAYHGPGDKPTPEAVSDLNTGEVVVLRFRTAARRASAGAGASAGGRGNARVAAQANDQAVLAATTTPTSGDRVVALVIDTGFAAA